MKAYIKSIEYVLPETIVTNEDLIREFPEWTIEKIADKIGIAQRHIVRGDETATDLAIKAAQKLLDNHLIDRASIDFLLFCTQSPEYFLPTSACLIQHKLGLRTNIGAFDFNLGCSGYVYGLSVAKGLIFGGIAKNVVLLTAETYSKYLHPKDKGNRTIFGDGATATLISTEGIAEIGDFCLGTDGRGAENLIIKTGASRLTEKRNDLTYDENGNPISSDYLYMNGGEIFNFTIEAVPSLVSETLEKNQLKQTDVNMFVFHQANKFMINYLRKKIKISEDKFYVYLESVGNTVSSTIPIALFEAQKNDKLKGNVLIAGFGVGYSWAGGVLKYV